MGSGITALGSGSQPRDRDHGPGIPGQESWDPDRPITWDQNGIRDQMLPHFGDQESKFRAKIWDQRWKNIPGYDPETYRTSRESNLM